ncbi:type II secretion system protein [Companilactobacillus sp. DQM5]|uniref:type II secretion system protein n=1 Tax=Companilactobacillus sp. DQM5 TaxID=3463359 RepID=UPI004059834A
MMEQSKKVNRNGFTLIETTVALFILTLIFAIPMNSYSKFNNNLSKSTFISEFKSNWNYSLVNSKINQATILVHLNKTTQDITFKNSIWKKKIIVPKNFYLESSGTVKIGSDGTVRPFTMAIRDLDTNKLLKFKVQMDWGEIIVD